MYLPKTKYKSNLYASGDTTGVLLKDSKTGKQYVGAYFITYKQEYFSGSHPSKDSVKLIPAATVNKYTPGKQVVKGNYDYIRNQPAEVLLKETLPLPAHYPQPGDGDSFMRYFAIDKSTGTVKEISKDTYKSINTREPKYYYPKYNLASLEWSLTDIHTNSRAILANNLNSYLKDPSQFVK